MNSRLGVQGVILVSKTQTESIVTLCDAAGNGLEARRRFGSNEASWLVISFKQSCYYCRNVTTRTKSSSEINVLQKQHSYGARAP
jgi:hypothetical protein